MLNVSLFLVKKSEYVTYSCMVSKGYIVYCLTALTCNQPIYKLLMLRRLFSNFILNQKQISKTKTFSLYKDDRISTFKRVFL